MRDRILQLTADGSHTIVVPELNVSYHSRYGAIQESRHVFVEAGLNFFLNSGKIGDDEAVRIFEMGFGTGLNALLSLNEAILLDREMLYSTVEAFPLPIEEVRNLNYTDLFNTLLHKDFLRMHECRWNERVAIHPLFCFEKSNMSIADFEPSGKVHVIYFDAFDPGAQPELWTETIFRKMFDMLENGGVLTTYSSKGSVRRVMQAVGFKVEKVPGPRGKREVVRARR